MIRVKSEIECDECHREESAWLESDYILPFSFPVDGLGLLQIRWKVVGFDEWGMTTNRKIFCPPCYQEKLAAIPKKKGLWRMFG
jgi:hypothetical protein